MQDFTNPISFTEHQRSAGIKEKLEIEPAILHIHSVTAEANSSDMLPVYFDIQWEHLIVPFLGLLSGSAFLTLSLH